MLPKMSGLEVCRRMRAERRVPLIMLTARYLQTVWGVGYKFGG
jgi:DNA-binding response OmpR family regulator